MAAKENREIIVHEATLRGLIDDLNKKIDNYSDDSYSEYCRGLRDAYKSILKLLD